MTSDSDDSTSLSALDAARRCRRIAKYEIESKYLKSLPSEQLEAYKHHRVNHAATVIQTAWRGYKQIQAPYASALDDQYMQGEGEQVLNSDEEYECDNYKGKTQVNSSECWERLSHERRRDLLEKLAKLSKKQAEQSYDAFDQTEEEQHRRNVQDCHLLLGKHFKLRELRGRNLRKVSILHNQLMHTEAGTNALDEFSKSVEIEYSVLPPLPKGERLSNAKKAHEESLASLQNSHEGKLASTADLSSVSDFKTLEKDIELHKQHLKKVQARVEEEWKDVNYLIELAKSQCT